MYSILSILDKVADNLEGKGFIKEASQVDIIANTVEASGIGSEGLRNVRNVIKKTSRPRDFVEIIKRIKMNIKGRPNARKILTALKRKTPREAIMTILEGLPTGTINRAVFEKAKRLAIRLLSDTEDVEEEMAEQVPESLQMLKKVANTLELDMTAVLIALLSGIAQVHIETISYIDVMKLIKPYQTKLNEHQRK